MDKRNSFICRGGLTAKMIGMSLLCGVLIWTVTQSFETRALQAAFADHLHEMLDDQARDDRLAFDRLAKRFQQTAQLIIGQQRFHRYFTPAEHRSIGPAPQLWATAPDWFLSRSAQRALTAPRCVLVFNRQRQLLESFCREQQQLPLSLRSPAALLLQKSLDQTHMTTLDGIPYMLSAATTEVAGEPLTLLLATPIDQRLLLSLNLSHDRLLALISLNERKVLISNDQELIPRGTPLENLERDYVISGRSFHDNGGAEMLLSLSSFLSRSEMNQMKAAFVNISWWQRTLSTLVLLLGPIPIILWVSFRVRHLTERVRGFCRGILRSKQVVASRQDELCELEDNVSALMDEVIDSHQLIRAETLHESELKSALLQQENQLQLLLAITDILHVGVLSQGEQLQAENSLMTRWADKFGGLEKFLCVDDHCGQINLCCTDGEESIFELRCLCLDDRRTVILVSDLTAQLALEKQREQLQAELLQAQKMESVGRLAGGIAHDFNNILMAISGNLHLMKRRLEAENPLQKYIEVIDNSANRAASLTKQLLGFSRKQLVDPRPHDINQIVRDLLLMLKRLIGENIAIKTSLADGLWPVSIDLTQIEQVVMNLAVNARDAMNDGGALLLESANVTLSEEYAQKHLGALPGDYVCLSVSDTGSGMSAEVVKYIFEPFYTTKPQGEGTGLGLSMVYGIVKQNGGNIYVYSEPEEGTTFKIYLPRTQEKIRASSVTKLPVTVARGVETILLVEDDSGVRAFAVELLSELGYTVLEASDGEEAVQLFEKYHGRIHLLLTDVVLPKMNGQRLASQLTARSSELAVVFMSGYTQNAIDDHGVLKEGIHFLPKPLSLEQLAQAVRTALDPQVK